MVAFDVPRHTPELDLRRAGGVHGRGLHHTLTSEAVDRQRVTSAIYI
jgi:hypothetical protein